MDDLDKLIDHLDRAGDELGDGAHKLVRATTLRTEALGKANAPVRTGALRGSITSDFDGGSAASTIRGETGPTVDYSHFVEHGTSRMAPQPYMTPAADRMEPVFYAGADALAAKVAGADG